MAWPAGTQLRPLLVDLQVSPTDDHLTHVGLGYDLASGPLVLRGRGFTWHSPDGGYAHAPAPEVAALQSAVGELLADFRSDLQPSLPSDSALRVVMITLHPDGSVYVRYRVELANGGRSADQLWSWARPDRGALAEFFAHIIPAAHKFEGVVTS